MVAERLDGGDLNIFLQWARAYVEADIWVECRVNFTSADPDLRPDAQIKTLTRA